MQRHGQGGSAVPSRLRAAGVVLLLAYLLFVGWLMLRPLSVPWVAPANLHPLATIRADFAADAGAGFQRVTGGLLLLAPLGVLLPVATNQLHRPALGTAVRTVFLGALLAATVSLLRSALPGQMVNVDSVLLNTAGVGLTHALFCPPLRHWLRRERRERAPKESRGESAATSGSPPRTARVRIAP
ncbi:VanZ family protein [Streptomyces sp. AJS327]|uniref:VanZ family protein n=1 Tax=Streptomyces sp. AJS327 TaxID=2545265 RepID=UPI0015DFDC59|nr:VanZ family protein [Streptomyces sp. AJS327]MBA0054199.1 VanZ family protein [Streptomyces sp. AJS327]